MVDAVETPSQVYKRLQKLIQNMPDANSITQLDINRLQVEAFRVEDDMERLTQKYLNLLLKYAELALEVKSSSK